MTNKGDLMKLSKDIVFLSGKRTPFGTFGGTVKDWSATDLAVVAAKAALAQANVRPEEVDHSIFGNALQTTADAIYLARHVALKSGCPQTVPALTLNRLCGSGFQSLVSAAEQLLLGEADIVLAGGTESMSTAPHVVRGARWGLPLGKSNMGDLLWDALLDPYVDMPMAMTAEKLGEKYGITREQCDVYAARSQAAWKAAQDAGRFENEVTPVEIKDRKGNVTAFKVDEHPRPQTTVETLAKLPPYFKKDGLVSAGNASGISDGAGAMVMTTMEVANASFTSTRSTWSRRMPVRSSARRIAGAGPIPMIDGSQPTIPHPRRRPIGFAPRAFATSIVVITIAPAPSEMPEALPAETSPSFLK